RRMLDWLPKLQRPIRSGEHSQSAFALGLVLDWARDTSPGDADTHARIAERVRALYAGDRAAPIEYEPSGHDFLSPALGEADVMRRACLPEEFEAWLATFLPEPVEERAMRWLTPVTSPDRADGK